MASEIRVNKINNRAGLGTVTYTDTGIIVSGISTATNFKTGSSNLHSTGLNVGAGDGLTFVHSTGINLGTGVTFSNVGNATFSGIITAVQFKGDGSQLSGIDASALKFGAATKVQATNTVFFENDKAVAVNYQITSTKNAMSAGPISINAGIAVTVPSGSSWTIV